MIIISREIVFQPQGVDGSRGKREEVAGLFGQAQTTFQMLAIIVLILVTDSSPDYLSAGARQIYLAAASGCILLPVFKGGDSLLVIVSSRALASSRYGGMVCAN